MKKLLIVLTIALSAVGVAGMFGVTQAEPPWAEKAMGPWVSSRIDYNVVASAARIGQGDAVRAARKFGQGSEAGQLHSIRLATFDHPLDGPRLVWVIDIAGLNLKGIGGTAERPGPDITRAVMLVSATDPDRVVAMYSLSD